MSKEEIITAILEHYRQEYPFPEASVHNKWRDRFYWLKGFLNDVSFSAKATPSPAQIVEQKENIK